MKEAWQLARPESLANRVQSFGARLNWFPNRPHLANRLRGAGAMKYHYNYMREISADNFKLLNGAWRDPKNWLGNSIDALGATWGWGSRMVGAQDDFFKMIGYRGEVASRAFRRASEEVARGAISREQLSDRVIAIMRNPPDDIRLASVDHARYQNFTDEPGNWVKAINKVEKQGAEATYLGGQVGALILRMLMPFRTTPSRLTWYAFERSPLAPLMGRVRDAIAAGGAARDLALTRMALGTMGLMTIMDLAFDGHITGGGPRERRDTGRRQTLLRSGWQPFSVRVPDGVSDKNVDDQGKPLPKYRYFSFNQLDPFGSQLGIAASLAEIINNADHLDSDRVENIMHIAAAAAASFGDFMLGKSTMMGPAELLSVLHAPDDAGKFLDNEIASYTGSGVRWLRRQVDPSVRYTSGLVQELTNRIPGLSSDLPPARDYWGRIRTYQSGMGMIYDATVPLASRVYDPEPIDKEAIENGFNMQMPSMTLSFGKGLNLFLREHPEFYSRFLEIRGQLKPSDMPGADRPRNAAALQGIKRKEMDGREFLIRKYGDMPLLELLNGVVTHQNDDLSPIYDGAGQGGKQDLIKHIVSDYTRAAKGSLLYESDELATKLNIKRAKKEAAQ